MKIIIYIITFLAIAPVTNGASFYDYPYNHSPRLVAYCEQGFIGYEYSEIKDRKCRKLWDIFTREIILDSPYIFNL